MTSENFKLYYGEFETLHGINVGFKENQITALIGPSGSGKSTFLRSINRMNDLISDVHISGSIKIDGEDIYDPEVDVVDLRKRVGMVFQQPQPFPFSIFENVAYGLKLTGTADKKFIEQRVEESLRQAAIWDEVKDRLHSQASALSGGQQQRVCIARVLAVRPEIILLDEPTSALDPISSAGIEDTLLELKSEYTLVMVTHNMQQASRIADSTAFMMDGNLIEYGATKKLFLNPDHQETSDYLNGKFG